MKCSVSLGSNLGVRRENLEHAARKISELPGVFGLKASPIIETPALVPTGAPEDWQIPYLNAAVEFDWSGTPVELLQALKNIEVQLGRGKTPRWAPRPIDLDILLCDGHGLQSEELNIPHAEMFKRAFVLEPLKHLRPDARILIAARRLKEQHPLWMGILNLSPDSFSTSTEGVDFKAEFSAAPETQIWDLGGESTRPGAREVSPEQEWERLKPALEYFRKTHQGRIFRPWLSVDTRRASTAVKALEMGADLINDVSGLSDLGMRDVLRSSDCGYILMHSLSVPADPAKTLPSDADPVVAVKRWAEAKLEDLERAGIDLRRVIFDPGLGFGKTARQSLVLLQRFEEFYSLPVRLLIGHSRKSFIQHWRDLPPAGRDPESVGISLSLAQRGADIIRVHRPGLHQRAFTAFQGAKI